MLFRSHWSFGRVYDRLRRRCTTWDVALKMRLSAVKRLIKDAGLSGQKAPRIRAILSRVRADFGEMSLDGLTALPPDEVQTYLLSLPGVGIKTAKCVMMYSLGFEVLPVDTHVWRVARRLELVPMHLSYAAVHDTLEAIVTPPDRFSFHVNAIAHGRQVCLPLRPRCEACILNRICPFPPRAKRR